MNKRQLVAPVQVANLEYAHLYQQGELNSFRVEWRECINWIRGEIITVLGSAKEINEYFSENVVSVLDQESENQ
jgi:hypothetical protein